MKLIIVRHGETFDNVNEILQGHTHGKLNENGLMQAKKVALRLKDEKIDTAYSSDLNRVIETANEILKFHPNVKLNIDKNLREISRGDFDGKHLSLFKEHKKTITVPYHKYKPENGESWDDVYHRVVNFYKSLIKKEKGKNVLIISHGGAISCLLSYFHNEPLENYGKFHPKNTAVTIIEIDENYNHKINCLNCVKHL